MRAGVQGCVLQSSYCRLKPREKRYGEGPYLFPLAALALEETNGISPIRSMRPENSSSRYGAADSFGSASTGFQSYFHGFSVMHAYPASRVEALAYRSLLVRRARPFEMSVSFFCPFYSYFIARRRHFVHRVRGRGARSVFASV